MNKKQKKKIWKREWESEHAWECEEVKELANVWKRESEITKHALIREIAETGTRARVRVI